MLKILKYFLDFVFPPYCISCKKRSISILCLNCLKKINFFSYNNNKIIFISDYCKENRKLIHSYKYYNNFKATKFITEKFKLYLKNILKEDQIDILISIPSYKKKNHLDNIVRELSKEFNIYEFKEVYRIRKTKPQSSLNIKERKENVKDCFQIIDTEFIKGKNILFIDDIYTTGATLNSIVSTFEKKVKFNWKALIYAKTKFYK